MDIKLLVHFKPLEKIQKPTKEHKKAFCPCVKKFVATLSQFSDSVANNSDCLWDENDDIDIGSGNGNNGNDITTQNQKRGLLQDDTSVAPAGNNYYGVIMNYPNSAVQEAFAPNSPDIAPSAPIVSSPSSSPSSAPSSSPLSPPSALVVGPNDTTVVPAPAPDDDDRDRVRSGSNIIGSSVLVMLILALTAILI
jgi:hypothetical protein